MRSAGTSTSVTPRKENSNFTGYFGGSSEVCFTIVAYGVGDRRLKHHPPRLASQLNSHAQVAPLAASSLLENALPAGNEMQAIPDGMLGTPLSLALSVIADSGHHRIDGA